MTVPVADPPVRFGEPAVTAPVDPDRVSAYALLRCCLRELGGCRQPYGPYLEQRLGGALVRARLRQPTVGPALHFTGPVEELRAHGWQTIDVARLARLTAAELTARTGLTNAEFVGQVAGSAAVIRATLTARDAVAAPDDPWLESEQALVCGHPCHPSPKARGGGPEVWLEYAPEAHARFPLRILAVRDDVLAEEGDRRLFAALDNAWAPAGYRALPAHPWQLRLLAGVLRAPLADGRLLDLGEGPTVVPTSSVRTVYEPTARRCLKFSLDVRITNCVRKSSWYELRGAVELTRRLRPVFAALARDFAGTGWLAEPAYRSVNLGRQLFEGLGVIVRDGPWQQVAPGVTPVLAGAIASEHSRFSAAALAGRCGDPTGWWTAYVDRIALPVLHAYIQQHCVLEPHLQNVLVGVNESGTPAAAIFRDLEGTKLVAGRHDVSGLPERVASSITHDARRGWQRVTYCLIVNHLAEVAAVLAHGAGIGERKLWALARDRFERYADIYGCPRPLADLLSGAPLPAKANLWVRWVRRADRHARYVAVPNPLSP